MANDPITYPLSFSQESLWFLHQLDPSNTAYNNVSLFSLTGPLEIAVLEKSFNEVIQRHETLRSIFPAENGVPRQVVLPFKPRPLAVMDYTGTPQDQWESKATDFAAVEKRQPIDLAAGPMIRAFLFVFSSDFHILVIHLHHMVTDAWSETLILRELAVCYDSFSRGVTPGLTELKMKFGEYARWQRGWMAGERLDKYLSYWKEKFASAIHFLDLPADFQRPRFQTYNGMCHSTPLPRTLVSSLKAFGQRERLTPFMVLLTAFKALLFRYTGQEDIIVGSPFANRSPKETEDLIGYFVNTLPLRTSLEGDPSFRQLTGRVRKTVLDAFQYQALPFERMVEDLKIERDLSRTPVFQVVMNMLNVPPRPATVGDLRIERIYPDLKVTPFDLMIDVRELDGGLTISLTANTDLFAAESIRRFSSHFTRLLDGALADPDTRLSRLPLLTEDERARFNAGIRPQHSSPAGKCIHELFETQVEKTPEATALVFQDQTISYRELNRRANRLARRLRAEGVAPKTLVGLCVDRSPDMIIGMLAILKAGGAYVPIDPDYPQERLAFILKDAAIPLVLVQRQLLQVMPENGTKLVSLEAGEENSTGDQNLAAVTKPDQLAYIIYTSGSTGQPKGVMVTHENVVRLFQETRGWFHFDAHDVWSLFHSFAFDFSVWEIWGALLFGGRLVIVPDVVSRTPEEFYRLICREGITVLSQTPSYFFRLMAAEQALGRSPDLALETVIFGGEMLSFQRLRPWFERHGEERPRLVNMYGITEATVHVTYRPIQAADSSLAGSMIGRPIPDLTVNILDANFQPVPPGVRGEMFVGGAGLARGYLNRPELTRERFLPNPFSEQPGDRLYRTGDMARFREDGDIEYMGRMDDQVKIHGFRVELGEIETAVMSHPGVGDAAVVLRREQPEDQRLVVFYVPEQGSAPTAGELRQYLTRKLPGYMLPSNFVELGAIPVTSRGKVDRRMLESMEIEEHAPQYVPPKDRFEAALVEIWQKVLGVEQVGMTDNFFELGGHSLLAAELFAKIENEFGRTLPLAALFEDGTVSYIAQLIRSVPADQAKPLIIPMQLDQNKPPIFLAPGGGAELVYLFDLSKQLGRFYSVYGLQSILIENDRLLTIPEMAMRYIPEIRAIQPVGPYYLLGHSTGGMVAMEIAHQLLETGAEVGLVGLLDTYAPGGRYKATWPERLLIHGQNIIRAGSARERVAYLLARPQRLFFKRIRPSSLVDVAIRKGLIPRDRGMLSALSQFNYNPPFFEGRLTVFRAADRPWYVRTDPLAGWKDYARQVDFIEMTGSHMTHLSEPHVQELVERLQTRLKGLKKTS